MGTVNATAAADVGPAQDAPAMAASVCTDDPCYGMPAPPDTEKLDRAYGSRRYHDHPRAVPPRPFRRARAPERNDRSMTGTAAALCAR